MMFMIERNAAAHNGVVKSNHETMLGLMSKAAKRGQAKPRQPAKIISAMYLALLLGVLKSINAAWATGCEPAVGHHAAEKK